MKFFDSAEYWDNRYKLNGNSGAGSYGKLAEFKSNVLNNFVKSHDIDTVVEFGCGDGNQLKLAEYPSYTGYDVSSKSIELCRQIFKDDDTKHFRHMREYTDKIYDLSLSLDVIYHLIEDQVYYDYIQKLFASSGKFVIIYSSNDDSILSKSSHVKHRTFSLDVPDNFRCIEIIKNSYPYDGKQKKTTSFCDFYVYERIAERPA